VLAFGSCAQTRTVKTKIYEDRRTGVTLHRAVGRDKVPFAKGYSHPVGFDVEDLKFLLGAIGYHEKGLFGWSEVRGVFTADELYRLTPHMAEAFAKATPDDEVLFRLTTAKRGAFFFSERFTNGRMFVKEGKLNCLFANVDVNPASTDIYDGDPRNYYSGVSWRLAKRDWQSLVEGEKGTHYNWVEMDLERGLAEKGRRERALREKLERRRAEEISGQPEKSRWEDWEPNEAVKPEMEEDVYFPPSESP
jgi:hypothetical protein